MNDQPGPSRQNRPKTYKEYLLSGSTAIVPKRTRTRWNKKLRENLTTSPTVISYSSSSDDFDSSESDDDQKESAPLNTHTEVTGSLNDSDCHGNDDLDPTDSGNNGNNDSENDLDFSAMSSDSEIDSDVTDTEDDTPILNQEHEPVSHVNNIPIPNLMKILLLVKIKIQNKITDKASVDIMKLMNLCSGHDITAPSDFLLKKIFITNSTAEKHHICPYCFIYAGIIDNKIHPEYTCVSCTSKFDAKRNIDKGNVFIHLSLGDQLKDLLENHDVDLIMPDRNCAPESFNSIMDGVQYRKTMSRQGQGDNFLSLSFSCDGVPVFKSSKYSLWPVLCTLNELSPKIQRSKVMIASIWFGVKKPDMSQYLLPFVQECKTLHGNGITVIRGQASVNYKVFTLVSVCDTVARPMLQNSIQFNGKYGCGYCLHPGQMVTKGRGNVRVYPNNDATSYEDRNHQNTVIDMTTAKNEGETVNGMKGLSVLLQIPKFDIIHGIIPDYMHCVLLGVARQFMKLWLDTSNHKSEFYLGPQEEIIDQRLLVIQPPCNISRTPRSVTERRFWKAHEWYCWLLIYSIPVLKGLLSEKLLFHWGLLVDSIYLLLKENVLKSEAVKAGDMIKLFITLTGEHYGIENVSYNIHMLSHLSVSVINWGPLWTHSAFLYENYNAELLAFVRSSKGVAKQICSRFQLKFGIPKIAKLCLPHMSAEEKELYYQLSSDISLKRIQHSLRIDETTTALGSASPKPIGRNHFLVLKRIFVDIKSSETIVNYYDRIVINSELYHSRNYTRVKKRNNYTALLEDKKTVFSIETYIVYDRKCYAVGYQFKIGPQKCCRDLNLNHLLTLSKDCTLMCISTKEIVTKVVYFEVKQRNGTFIEYGALLPNRFEVTA